MGEKQHRNKEEIQVCKKKWKKNKKKVYKRYLGKMDKKEIWKRWNKKWEIKTGNKKCDKWGKHDSVLRGKQQWKNCDGNWMNKNK